MKTNAVFASREPNRAAVLLEAISRHDFALTVVGQAKEVQGLLSQRGCDLLLVASQLSDTDGLQLVKALRSRSTTRQVPIIAVLEHAEDGAAAGHAPVSGFGSSTGYVRTRTATVAAESVSTAVGRTSLRLAFFQAGADECLTLNQDIAECLARIKAVLRRTSTQPAEEVIRMGPIELNLTSYTLRISGKEVLLTSKELDLLYVFLSSPNRVLSRPYLIERVWGYNYFGSPRTVDVHVRRLREKLGKAAGLIHTIPCVGYKLVPPGGDIRR
ncbi:MAG: response regulator transcription factor [Elusimicrobia bacterium]|nr:response regulator transcription factor [Elusimicrobiota bacterium]